jgi:hypothetical protein
MLVLFVASLKFFFVEGGEQFIVGARTAKKIGIRSTLKITIDSISFAIVLFFFLYYSHGLNLRSQLHYISLLRLYSKKHGAVIPYIALAVNSKRFLSEIPLKKLRLIAAILLTITATPLIIYSAGLTSQI